jgi:cytolysin (calcineurin-like family phosphatase)
VNEVLRVCVLQDDEGSGHIHIYAVDRFKAVTEVTDQYNIVAVHYEDEGSLGFAVLKKKGKDE